jgi:TonB family protein
MPRLGSFSLSLILLTGATAIALAQQSAPQPDKDGAYWEGDGVKAPRLSHAALAAFPSEANLAGTRRGCALSVVIGANGASGQIQSADTQPDAFNQSAIAAVKASEFAPGTLHGDAVPVHILLLYSFVPGRKPVEPKVLSIQFDKPPVNLGPAAPDAQSGLGAIDESKKPFVQGTVVVSALITTQGLPIDLHIEKSLNRDMDQKALDAVRKYRFRPASKEGIPIPARIMVAINFRPS